MTMRAFRGRKLRKSTLAKFKPVLFDQSGSSVEYLLEDNFTTDESAPITNPRTCEPGPGELNIVDTGNALSISDDILISTQRTTTSDPRFLSTEQFERASGLASYWKLSKSGSGNAAAFGFSSIAGQGGDGVLFYFYSTLVKVYDNTTLTNNAWNGAWPYGEFAEFIFIMRSTGAFYLIKDPSFFTEWSIYWVGILSASDGYISYYAGSSGTDDTNIDTVKVFQMPSPWDDDANIYTDYDAMPASDTEFEAQANCIIDFTITTIQTSGTLEIRFRIQDSSNYWRFTHLSTGSAYLHEVVAGTPTQRVSMTAVLANQRVQILCNDEKISIWAGTYGTTLKSTYAFASNFKTDTGAHLVTLGVDQVLENFYVWPVTLSGDLLSEIERFIE